MKIHFIFLAFLITIICCSKENKTNIEQSNLIPIQVLKGEITKDGAGDIKIGNSISETVKRLDKFNLRRNDFYGFDVYDKEELVISFWSKHQNDTIGFVKVFSDKFKTKDGLKVGLSLNEIQGIRNDFVLSFDEMDYREYFAPKELQIYQGDIPEQLCLFYFNSKEDNLIGANYELDDSGNNLITSEFIRGGKIDHVLIYLWR